MRYPGVRFQRSTLCLLVTVSPLQAQRPAAARYDPAAYEQSSADIAMRDGVSLHVEIFRPKQATGTLPILFSRTPYGVGGSRSALTASYQALAEDGYIFVFQDIRGRYRSQGTFVMQRPPQVGACAGRRDRRDHRYRRLDRLAARERPGEQQAGRNAGGEL